MGITGVFVVLVCQLLARVFGGYQPYWSQQQVDASQRPTLWLPQQQTYPLQAPYAPQGYLPGQPNPRQQQAFLPWQQPNPPQQQGYPLQQPYWPNPLQGPYGPPQQPYSPSLLRGNFLPSTFSLEAQPPKCQPPAPICQDGQPATCIIDAPIPYYHCVNGRAAFPWPGVLQKHSMDSSGSGDLSGSRTLLEDHQPEPSQPHSTNMNSLKFPNEVQSETPNSFGPYNDGELNGALASCPCLSQALAGLQYLHWTYPGYPTNLPFGQTPGCQPGQPGCFGSVIARMPLSPSALGYPQISINQNSGTIPQSGNPVAQGPVVAYPNAHSPNVFPPPNGPFDARMTTNRFHSGETNNPYGNLNPWSRIYGSNQPQLLTQPFGALAGSLATPPMVSGYQIQPPLGYLGYQPPPVRLDTQWRTPVLGSFLPNAPNLPYGANPYVSQRYDPSNDPKRQTKPQKPSGFLSYLASQNFPVPGKLRDSHQDSLGAFKNQNTPSGYQNQQSQPKFGPLSSLKNKQPTRYNFKRPGFQNIVDRKLREPSQQQFNAPTSPFTSQYQQPPSLMQPGLPHGIPQNLSPWASSQQLFAQPKPLTATFPQPSPYFQNPNQSTSNQMSPQNSNSVPQNRKPYLETGGLSLLPPVEGQKSLDVDEELSQSTINTVSKKPKHHNRSKNKHNN